MNRHIKEFLHRGLIFAGFGPVILGIIYAVLEKTVVNFHVDGTEILVSIVSIYCLAFIQAGASVFNQIENWSMAKSIFWHFFTLYIAYVGCYIINSWIPFNIDVILVFTAVFAAIYIVVWVIVYTIVKLTTKKLNERL